MTAEKKTLTEEEREEARRLEIERIKKALSVHPGITIPTRDKSELVFAPIKIRGKPLSQTIIEDRR